MGRFVRLVVDRYVCSQLMMTRSVGASKTFATGAGNTLPAAVTRSVNKTPRARAALIGTDATSTPRRSRPKATGETHQTSETRFALLITSRSQVLIVIVWVSSASARRAARTTSG